MVLQRTDEAALGRFPARVSGSGPTLRELGHVRRSFCPSMPERLPGLGSGLPAALEGEQTALWTRQQQEVRDIELHKDLWDRRPPPRL